MYTLIKNGKLVLPTEIKIADILIKDEKIFDIGSNLYEKYREQISNTFDADKHFVIPGGIDVHTHMQLPLPHFGIEASDDFSSGTLAALQGGTTTIIDFANQSRTENDSLTKTFEKWQQKALGKVHCDYGLHLSVTIVNEQTKHEVKKAVRDFGITSFKTFLAYPAMKISEEEMLSLMHTVRDYGGILTVHAEDGKLIEEKTQALLAAGKISPASHPLSHPIIAEINAIHTMARLQAESNCPTYIVHLSSSSALTAGENTGLLFETCPQYLLLNDSVESSSDFDVAS
ncbi:MAG: amidohydrolase family protein [Oligoflexia bacterium]|nr:amidohydrolase family protein [Oligoflexia bacterium]